MSDFVQKVFDSIASKNLEMEKDVGLTKKMPVDLSQKSKEVDNLGPSELFMAARDFAGEHIQQYINSSPDYNWVKVEHTHPCFDHFNFKYKNQIFSILIDIKNPDGKSFMPPEFIKRQLNEAEKNNLIPCTFPVVINNPDEPALNTMKTFGEGINLFHTITSNVIVPEDLGSDDKIQMSNWELHNYAIMQIRMILKQKNVPVISFQDIPVINPQLWMIDNKGNKCWVVIRHYVGNEEPSMNQDDLTEITRRCFKFNGYFCSVGFNPSKESGDKCLYRNSVIETKINSFKTVHTFV